MPRAPHYHGSYRCPYEFKKDCTAASRAWRAANKVTEADLQAARDAERVARRDASFESYARKEARRVAKLAAWAAEQPGMAEKVARDAAIPRVKRHTLDENL